MKAGSWVADRVLLGYAHQHMILRGVSVGVLVSCLSCAPQHAPNDHARNVVIPPPVKQRPEQPGEMVRLQGGTFKRMARWQPSVPAHPETVATFEIGRTEVTTNAYRECVKAGACSVPVGFQDRSNGLSPQCVEQLARECNFGRTDREDHPINCVTFTQAEQYCRFRGARLPTEAEWEFAALGTENRPTPWGDDPWDRMRANLCDEACVSGFACPFVPSPTRAPDGFAATAPVGSFRTGDTPEGVHDLLGNVWEWSIGEPCGAQRAECDGSEHVMRGGGWSGSFMFEYRDTTPPSFASSDFGFRCARSIAPVRP